MTLRHGVDWGARGALPTGAPIVTSDAAAARIVTAGRARRPVAASAGAAAAPPPVLGLAGGDLWRTLGAPGGGADRLTSADAVSLPLDAVRAVLDGDEHWFVAHLVARAVGWRGRFVLAMNAEWLGEWKVAPRAHPGDGLLDVLDGALPWRERLVARRRIRTGDHLPHPALSVRRAARWSADLGQPLPVWLDGQRIGRVRRLCLEIFPAAFTAHV